MRTFRARISRAQTFRARILRLRIFRLRTYDHGHLGATPDIANLRLTHHFATKQLIDNYRSKFNTDLCQNL